MNATILKSTSYDARLANNWAWCNAYFDRKTKDFKITGWCLRLNRRKTSLGMTNYTTKTVSVSYHFLRGPTCDEKIMRETILHELAHVLTPGEKHSETWRKMAVRIGCSGNVKGCMDKPEANYIMECLTPGCQKATYYRRPKYENKICGHCRSPFILKKLH